MGKINETAAKNGVPDFKGRLYLELRRTIDAGYSILLPVCLLVLFCDNAEPASFLAICDELSSFNIFAANDATFFEVCLVFLAIIKSAFI
ncbi:MAG: hypothetical protein PF489_03540 [Salinivirgaceae bacterium]|nr:hypothetical protein [Salinivirgaceae bacterium]